MKFSYNELTVIHAAVLHEQAMLQAWINAKQTAPAERAEARTKLVTINRILERFNDEP